MFEQLQSHNEKLNQDLDKLYEMYSKVEGGLKDRMKDMLEVKSTMEVIAHRQDNLETIQKNMEKLEQGRMRM